VAFVYRYVQDGRQKLETLGRWPVLDVQEAKKLVLERKQQQLVGSNTSPLKERQVPGLAEYCQHYLDGYAKARKRSHSVRDDQSAIRLYIVPAFGDKKIDEIKKSDIANLHYKMCATPYRANRVLALLSTIFGLAVGDELRGDNPVKGIERYPEEPRQRWLGEGELKRLIQVLEVHPSQLNATALLLMIATGARKMEVLGARWSEFDLEAGVWTKPSTATKQKRAHIVELNDYAVSLLKAQKLAAVSEFVFCNPKTGLPLRDLKPFWRDVCTQAGLVDVRIHDLRHTFASMLANKGVALEVIGQLLGHSSLETTMRYAHLLPSTRREAANKVGEVILNQL